MVGFIAEFMVFRATFAIFTIPTLICLVGTGLTAVYFLLMVNRVFFGRLPDNLAAIPRVAFKDHLPSLVLTALLVIFGLQPAWVVRWSENQATDFVVSPELRRPTLGAAVRSPVFAPPIAPTVSTLSSD